ncbi:STAS domain-containing protein [Nonomuraea cavernae]|uniref:STAS domain-containing protein n=1 Tax=Nonomuraea cavernae TaxID=2045107 RepID=UPI0033E7BCF0
MNTADPPGDLTPIRTTGPLLRITPLVDLAGLRIEGELDRATLPALPLALASMSGRGSFSVDLSGLVFCDVGGLRTLVIAAVGLRGGHILTMRSPSPQVRRLLKLTGWHETAGLRLQAQSLTLPGSPGPTHPGRAHDPPAR